MPTKIYISGKISGMEAQASTLFTNAEKMLKAKGFEPVNPMKLPHQHGKTWECFMREDIAALLQCQAIYMLHNWQQSKGAVLEYILAMHLDMDVQFQILPQPILPMPEAEPVCSPYKQGEQTTHHAYHIYAVTGTHHGSLIEAINEGEARAIFHKAYHGESIIHVAKKGYHDLL
jgi:hypothetical protein